MVTGELVSTTVLDIPWTVSASELTRSLHWLPVRQRIRYKVGLLRWLQGQTLTTSLPLPYLLELLSDSQTISTSQTTPVII